MDLPHSDGCFVKAYPAETAEAFCNGHNGAFCYLRERPHSPDDEAGNLSLNRVVIWSMSVKLRFTASPSRRKNRSLQ
jgi:hypothetical protein